MSEMLLEIVSLTKTFTAGRKLFDRLEKQQMIPGNIKAQLNEKYGLDKSVFEQYVLFVKKAVALDFGYSMAYPGRTVVGIFREQLDLFTATGTFNIRFLDFSESV